MCLRTQLTTRTMKYRLLQVVLVLSLVALCSSALSKHYYIVSVISTDSACQDYQNGTCLILEQLAQSDLTSAGGTNLTLSFLPGEHLLTQSLAIHNFSHVQINGMSESMVSFHGRNRIEILHSDELNIENLDFVHHIFTVSWSELPQGLDIRNAHNVFINNCSFVGMDNQYAYYISAVKISGAWNIVLDRFTARGNYGNVVYIESQCNVTILNSEFTENVGDVVQIYSTNTVISDSKFHGNTGEILMIDSATTFITQVDINNNINPNPIGSNLLIYIDSLKLPSKLKDSSTSGCSVPSSYSVVTSDTAVHVGSKASMNSSLLPTKATQNSEAVNNTMYHCTDISDVSASELRNISNVSDIIYDFTTSNFSNIHGNKGRLCVNTHNQHTLPFINRVVYCDDQIQVVITEFESDGNQDNARTNERVGTAKKNESSQVLIGADNTNNNHPTLVITSCTFTNNTSQYGALNIEHPLTEILTSANVFITSCSFTNNTSSVNEGGGAISIFSYSYSRSVHISSCSFIGQLNRGAIYMTFESGSFSVNLLLSFCSFTNNTSHDGGAIFIYSDSGNVLLTSSSFTNNTSQGRGGAISMVSRTSLLITSCSFTNNTSQWKGGAILIYFLDSTIANVLIMSSSFANNTSLQKNYYGGAIYLRYFSRNTLHVLLASCSFTNNVPYKSGGAAVYVWTDVQSLKLSIVRSKFKANAAQAVYLIGVSNATVKQSDFTDNEYSIFYLEQSSVTFLSGNLFSNNNGSVYAFNSEVTFEGSTIFSNNYHLAPIYAVQSQIHFNSPEGITITNNTASLGGGIYLIESTMTVSHPIEISQNTADYGGGIYAYLSTIEFTSEEINKQIMITNNNARQSGGGICAIASTIKTSRSYVNIDSNTALVNGGGMYLKQNSRVTLLKRDMEGEEQYFKKVVPTSFNVLLKISNNSACYGGGIFIEDKTADGSLCNGSATEIASISSSSHECFIQTIRLYDPHNPTYMEYAYTNLLNIFIINNTATISGDGIFGGLFDRCAVSLQTEAEPFVSSGLDYISKIVAFESEILQFTHIRLSVCVIDQMRYKPTCFYSTNLSTTAPRKIFALVCENPYYYLYNFKHERITSTNICLRNNSVFSSISSEPVQVMFCNDSVHMDQSTVHVKKGGPFKVHALAMDQVGNPVNATIHSSVVTVSGVGRLKEGQTEQTVGNQCTQLEYNVFSQDSSAQLELYADGPCTNLGISRKVINITFLPCICAIGLHPSQSKVDCQCVCDPRLQPYQITNCSQKAGTIKLETNIWIGVEENSINGTGYIIHDCPFDYCVEKPVNISLNTSQERDRQCAFNRSGILCGECQQGLSLVLATSRCKECSNIYLLLLIPFALAGIVLVVFILLFNITIATGTIHGLIFYANVLAANKAIFLPFTTPNFLTVFISWVNLDLGIETCFYSQMGSQTKVLLQLVFPAYLFILIFLIIIMSRYFNLFAELLSNRNPVAALATLIVLSYSKLLRFIIAALQNTVLDYPDGSQERVWLYDANIQYFTPSHIPRFVAAAIILTVGGLFTVLLFFSQWLPRCSNWKLMKWTRNTKYTGFMDAFHAPFTPKHRYWVGLLLFALIVHNTVAAMATDTFLPVLSANSVSVGLIVLRVFSSRVYKDWSKDCLETLFLVNLTTFAAGVLYVRDNRYGIQTIAYMSMAVAFTLFVTMISYHFYKYVLAKTSIWPKITDNLKNAIAGLRLRQAGNRQEMYQLVADDQMDDDELLEALDYNNDQPDIVDPPYTGGGEEEANTNQYHTPPNIVPATRPDQLREPDLDDLAPITTDDYRPAPHPPRPRANNRQRVTYTVIEPIAAHEEDLV